jgi:hypothetical protein
MDLVGKRKIAAVFAGGLLAAVLAAAPALAEDDMLFGQPAPKRFLLNKMLNPQTSPSGGGNGQATGAVNGAAAGGAGQAAGANGQVAAGDAQDPDDDGPGPFPKRYLLNKIFDGNK